MTMKQQIALEMARAEKIRQIRLDFQAEMKALDKKDEEEKILVGLLQNGNGGN